MPIDTHAPMSNPQPNPAPSRRSTPHGDRGVILVFVVVFLVLLAIIGAAFVSATRIDRMQIGNLGGRNIERDPNIRDVYDQAVEAVLEGLSNDPLLDVDGLGDGYMASLLPRLVLETDATSSEEFVGVWPKVSAPLGAIASTTFAEDFFIGSIKDPFTDAAGFRWHNGVYGLSDDGRMVGIWDQELEWYQGGEAALPERKRIFPALRPLDSLGELTDAGDFLQQGQPVFAGDADGDGIADCGMSLVVLDDSFPVGDIDRYLRGDRIYVVGYRIVDKNAQVNVNTARSRDGMRFATTDGNVELEALTDQDNGEFGGNIFGPTLAEPQRWGFFRSDVGLIELFEFSGLNAVTFDDAEDATLARLRELHQLDRARLGLVNESDPGNDIPTVAQIFARPLDVFNNDWDAGDNTVALSASGGEPEVRTDFYYNGVGDVMEWNLAARSDIGGRFFESPDWDGAADREEPDVLAAAPYLKIESNALHFRGGYEPRFGDSSVADDLRITVGLPAYNQSGGRGPLIDGGFNVVAQPFLGQVYPFMVVEDDGDRIFQLETADGTGGTINAVVPINDGAFFDPNVAPADGHGSWLAAGKIFTDDPDFLLAGNSPEAYTWKFSDASAENSRFVGPGVLHGANDGEFAYFRSLRSLITTENGIVLGVQPIELLDTVGTPANPTDPGLYGSASAQALARTHLLLGWTQEPLVVTNPGLTPDGDAAIAASAASANTSTVRELGRAYYHLMADPTNRLAGEVPIPQPGGFEGTLDAGGVDDVNGTENSVFRSTLRYPRTAGGTEPNLSAAQMALLRAFTAAVNTKDLRDADDDITAYWIDLGPLATDPDGDEIYGGGTDWAGTNVSAIVYGVERQPYITEVVVWDVGGTDSVAIELYNPHEADITLNDWYLVAGDRTTGAAAELTLPATPAAQISLDSVVVPANGYVVIASDPTPIAPGATTWKATIGNPGTFGGGEFFLDTDLDSGADLAAFVDEEMYLMRPLAETGLPATDSDNLFDGEIQKSDTEATELGVAGLELHGQESGTVSAPNFANMVPVDQVDLRNMIEDDHRYLYQRQTGSWAMVYPGRHDRSDVDNVTNSPTFGPDGIALSNNGAAPLDGLPQTDIEVHNPAASVLLAEDPGYFGTRYTLGLPNEPTVQSVTEIQVQNFRESDAANLGTTLEDGETLPDGSTTASPELRAFPFGMFPRDGDLLQVTMFGSHKLFVSPAVGTILQDDDTGNNTSDAIANAADGRVIELTSVSMDLGYMTVPDPLDTTATVSGIPSNIGRFDPIQGGFTDDYTFAADLFEVVRAGQVPGNDYFPNVRREEWGPYVDAAGGSVDTLLYDFRLTDGPARSDNAGDFGAEMPDAMWDTLPKPIDNDLDVFRPSALSREQVNNDAERLLPVQGRININTAPAEVLAMLPLVVDPATGEVDGVATTQMAIAIANYRDGIVDETIATSGDIAGGNVFESVFDLLDADDDTGRIQFADDGEVTAVGSDNERINIGNFTPVDGSTQMPTITAGTSGSWESEYNRLTRISNLITTRSDSFDVYIVVQSWGGWGAASGGDDSFIRLIDERRGHFQVNRGRTTTGGFTVTQFAVPPKD
ncbi:MAG: hypothetical protein AAGD32_07920 [Planctomycetota bacterium]